MKKEIMNFIKRGSWLKIERKKVNDIGRKVIKTKKIFKINHEPNGTLRYKTRDVVKGFMKIPGVDYTDSFSPG